jgi:DNA-binding response OmpR family regulator
MNENSDSQHRILVVDDEPNIVDVVSMALRFQGFEIESAGTGADALAAVASFKPHLIVLDVMLPDMEGFDVAQRLGAQRARVPIIFLTARDATDDKIRGLTLGGDDYVTKPFSLEELVARIRSILRRSGLAEPESSRLTFSTRRRTRSRGRGRTWSSPRPSTGSCATSCSTRGASSRARSSSSTSGSTTSAATRACSRPTSATCARSSTSTGRR